MTNLTARFQMIDDMSAKMDVVGRRGEEMVDHLEDIGEAAEGSFGNVKSGSVRAAQSIDGIATAATSAGQEATQMGDEIADAARKATEETEKLGKETEDVGKKSKDTEESGKSAVEEIAEALAAAGIVAMVKETAEAVYELADSFSDAEKTITASTGATGKELDALMASAERVFSSSHAENLDQVATAMSSVRKATGLVGEELENATQYGLALEDTLGYDVPQSASTASSLMKNFGLTAAEAYNLIVIGAQSGADKNGDLLDVLNEYSAHYAALGLSAEEFMSSLIDGAEAGVFSVDKVGNAVKEFNIRAKDGSETSGQAFEMLGLNAEEMAIKFAAGGEQASEAFFTVVNALNSMQDPMAKNTAAVALFGTMYEDLEANILPVLGNIEGGTLSMHDALSTVTGEAKSLSDKWTEAGNSIETAFTNAVAPPITRVSETMAEFTKSVGDYLQQHPGVAKAITAVGVGLGVVVLGIGGVTFATSSAIPAIVKFGASLNAALGPVGWVSLAISGVVAAGTALALMWEKAGDETLEMTSTTRQQYYELKELEAVYQDACDTYGENSEEASRLRYQLDDLSASFKENRQTIEEFAAECQSVIDAHTEMVNRFDENNAKIDNSEISTYALIQKLSDLADGTYQTADSQAAMQAIIDELNGSVAGLALSYSDVISNQDGVIQNLKEMALAEAERSRQQEMYDEYVELIKQQAVEQEQLAKATDEATAAQLRFEEAKDNYKGDQSELDFFISLFNGTASAYRAAKENLETANEAKDDLERSLEDTEARILEIETAWGLVGDAMDGTEGKTISWENASNQAFTAVQTEMEELIQAYQDVYTEALTSFEGQFGLFEEASTKSDEYREATVKNAQKAMDSQLEYWESYAANLETLQGFTAEQLNLTQEQYDTMMSYVQDGSVEAAGLAQSMVNNINKGNEEAVTKLAVTMADVATKREEIAANTADWATDFSRKMDELTAKMEETVDGLNLDTEAAASAKATIDAYAASILESRSSAVSAANQVSDAVEAALAATNARINVTVSGGTPGHATGTTYAEDVFIAGEEGPELIVGHEGATVFPTSETDRIVNAVNGMNNVTSVTFAEKLITALERYNTNRNATAGSVLASPERVQEPSSDSRNTPARDKIIRLEIAGTGSLSVGGSASKEEVVELMYANLKPVLMSIVQEEIFEEGDSSYDY